MSTAKPLAVLAVAVLTAVAFVPQAQAELIYPSVSGGAAPATIEVASAGNGDDVTGYGAVNYPYRIGVTEVTVGQWVDFLNSVAAADPYGLFSTKVDSYTTVTRSGSAGSYTYAAVAGKETYPITRVSYYDTLRYCNWLQNGEPVGPQGALTTENGAYDLSAGAAVTRSANAIYALPTADEWYKAAYYDPTLNMGAGGYYSYPTASDDAPLSEAPGDGENSGNFKNAGLYAVGAPDFYCDVDAYPASDSPFGTLGQGGNAGEWTEELAAGLRVIRGGSFDSTVAPLASTFSAASNPDVQYRDVGFRIVMLAPESPAPTPEPATVALMLAGGAALMIRRRRR